MPKDARQIPLTIGPTSDYGWLGGIAYNKDFGNKASYLSSGGIDPLRSPGILQTGFLASIVNASVTQQLTGAVFAPGIGGVTRLFGIGSFGQFYDFNTDTFVVNPTYVASMSNTDYGFAYFNSHIFLSRNEGVSITRLTKINPLNTGVSVIDALNSSMISSVAGIQIRHVLYPWKSNLYCLHANNIDYLDGNGAVTGILTQGARLPSGMVIKTATSYGDKIVVGASDNLTIGSDKGTICKVYFYDGISNDWQKEVLFPETDITNLVFNAGKLIGFGFRNSYVYNPTSEGWDVYKPIDATNPMTHNSHSINDGQLWFAGDGLVNSYGRNNDVMPETFNVPYSGLGVGADGIGAGICRWINSNTLYVSGLSTRGLQILSGGFRTGVRYKTRSISVDGTKFRVAWVRVVVEPLTTSDQATVEIVDDAGTTYVVGTLNGAVASDGPILSKEFFSKDFTSEPPYLTEFQLSLLFSAGNVKVRRVDFVLETAPEY